MTQPIPALLCRAIGVAVVLVLSIFSEAAAQHYELSSSSASFVPLTSPTAVNEIELDNALSAAIPIGFSFNYYGTPYSEIKASSDGFISFNAAASNPDENLIGLGSALRIIAPLWDDLGGTGGQASYKSEGAPGDRVFTFEWLNWKWNFSVTFRQPRHRRYRSFLQPPQIRWLSMVTT